jgi:hypothetical protein
VFSRFIFRLFVNVFYFEKKPKDKPKMLLCILVLLPSFFVDMTWSIYH